MTRTLLTTTILALALAGRALGAEGFDRSGAEKLGWKLGLQSWTVHQTVAQSIEVAQKIGVQYIEIYPGQPLAPGEQGGFGPGMTDEQISKTLDKAKAAGVQIIAFGVTGIPGKEGDARKVFEWAKKVGIAVLVSEPDPKDLPLIDKLAGEYGIKVAIHDHPKPSRYWDPAYVYGLVKDLKNVGYCADTGHWKRSGLDPVEVLKKYGDKVVSLHFKDLAEGHDVPWGTGTCNAAEMLTVLKEKGFKGVFSIEYEHQWDVPTLRKCVAFFYAEANKLSK